MEQTLEDYLKIISQNGNLFTLVVTTNPNNTQIYIHPTGRDGETIDLIVKGNKVEFAQ